MVVEGINSEDLYKMPRKIMWTDNIGKKCLPEQRKCYNRYV